MAISKHTLMLKHMLGEYLGPNISNQTFSHSKIEEFLSIAKHNIPLNKERNRPLGTITYKKWSCWLVLDNGCA